MPANVIQAVLEGKNKILFIRKFGTSESVKRPLLQTEHTFSYSRDLNSVVTKDGRAIAVGALETEIEMTVLQAKNDPAQTNIKTAVIKGEKYEIWEVTVDEELKTVDNKYPAVYCQGYFGTWEETATSEDGVELSTTLTVEYEPQFGETTLTADEISLVQYLFTTMDAQPNNSPLYIADTTIPTVTVSPADAATAVAVSANIIWTFSEAIKPAAVTGANFFVTDATGAEVAGALSINVDNTVVTFNPTANLTALTAYTAVATKNVTDLSGNALAANSVTNFTTA